MEDLIWFLYDLDEYPQTFGSPICAEQRCTSMQGCRFTKPKSRYCRVESYVDDRIVNEEDYVWWE